MQSEKKKRGRPRKNPLAETSGFASAGFATERTQARCAAFFRYDLLAPMVPNLWATYDLNGKCVPCAD